MQPSSFGKYILLDRISVGGMAEVFRAKAMGVEGFTRTVAVKRILPHLASDPQFVELFISEAKTAARLSHVNIVQVHELGRVDKEHFIAMEYISGRDLLSIRHQMRKRRSTVPIDLAARIIAQVAEGLAHAHNKQDAEGRSLGIVHRDVSPQNILVSYAGTVKLIDFGIAKAASKDSAPSSGSLKGKFGYMTPEQIESRPVDRRSDIFSLGVVLHELLTNERLFDGDNDFAVLERVREANVAPPSVLNAEVPDELDRICMRALAREPDERYQDASQMAEDLSRFVYTLGLGSPVKRLRHWLRDQFAAEFLEEQSKEARYRHFTMTSDGMVIEEPDEEDEPTALWAPAFDEIDDAPAPTMRSRPTTPPRQPTARPRSIPAASVPAPTSSVSASSRPPHAHSARPQPIHPRASSPSTLHPTSSPASSTPPPQGRADVSSTRWGAGWLTVVMLLAVLTGVTAGWFFWLRDPAPVRLELTVQPGNQLQITIDNTLLPQTTSPIIHEGLSLGRHSVIIERPGFEPWTASIDLRETQRLNVDLRTQPPVRVHFELTPPDAQITVNGQPLSDTQLRGRLALPPTQPAQIIVSAKGYKTLKTTLELSSEPTQSITYRLEPTPGSLFIESTPPATVFLDGKRVGRTPQFRDDLDVNAPIELRLEAPQHRVHQETLRFGETRTLQIERTLTRL